MNKNQLLDSLRNILGKAYECRAYPDSASAIAVAEALEELIQKLDREEVLV